MYALDDICTLITDGSHFSPEDEGTGYPMLSVKDMGETDFDFSACKYVGESAFKKLLANGCKPEINDVVVAKDGSYLKTAFPIKEERDIALLSSIAILRPKLELVTSEYLSYFLKSPSVYRTVSLNYITGTALKRIILKGIKRIPIQLPSIEEQKNRTAILDCTHHIIRQRKQQLQTLDDLIKARFVEMFGTIQNNTHGLAIGTLESVAEDFFAGGDKPSDCFDKKDKEHPYPVYANGYENGGLQGYSAKCRVGKSAVTVSARGTIGYCFIREAGFTPVVRLITIVPNDKVSLEYLKYAIDTMDIRSSGTSQAQLTVPDFKKEKIIVPPLSIQGRFATFVSQVDKSKVVVQKALDEAQILFDSLMQQYFG